MTNIKRVAASSNNRPGEYILAIRLAPKNWAAASRNANAIAAEAARKSNRETLCKRICIFIVLSGYGDALCYVVAGDGPGLAQWACS